LINLPSPITVPDNNFGVQINYVFKDTNTRADVDALLSDSLPTVGSSPKDGYWSDDTFSIGSFRGDDLVPANPGDPTNHENMYLRIDAEVPEPTSLAGVASAAWVLLARRRRSTSGGRAGAAG
jgi:hypothetical protein